MMVSFMILRSERAKCSFSQVRLHQFILFMCSYSIHQQPTRLTTPLDLLTPWELSWKEFDLPPHMVYLVQSGFSHKF